MPTFIINLIVAISEKFFLKWYRDAKYKQACNEATKRAIKAKNLRAGPDLPNDKLHYRD